MSNDLFRIGLHNNNVLPFGIYLEHGNIKLSLNDAERLVKELPKYIEEHKEYLAGNVHQIYQLEQQIAEMTLKLNSLKGITTVTGISKHQKEISYEAYNSQWSNTR